MYMRKLFLTAAYLFLSSTFLHVYSQTIEAYLSPPFPSELTTSKDGRTVAWVFNNKGSRNIYVSGKGESVKQVTHYAGDDGMEINQLAFAGDRIIFVRGNTS